MKDKLKESKDKIRQSALDRLSSLFFYVRMYLEPSTMPYKDAIAQIGRYKESIESKILAQLELKLDFFGELYAFEKNVKALVSEHADKHEYAIEFISADGSKNNCQIWANSKFGANIKFQSFKTLCKTISITEVKHEPYYNYV